MRIKRYFGIITCIVLFVLYIFKVTNINNKSEACNLNYGSCEAKTMQSTFNGNELKNKLLNSGENSANSDEEEDLTQKYKYLITSSAVTSVPWENDVNFKRFRKAYGTEQMMAAYCSILNDPLPGEEENVHIGAKLLCGTVVEPNKVFSQNNTIGPYVTDRGYKKGPTYAGSRITTTIGGGVCKIASTLYNVAVMSNLPIVERHAHRMPVSYVPYGQDATVCYGAKDFKFKNNTASPLLIWCKSIGNKLYIGFYGNVRPPKIQWHHEFLNIKRTQTIYRKNKSLKGGEEKVVVIGMDGAVLNTWVTIEDSDGTVITKKLGKSVYSPLPSICEIGT
ncbi:VanW family protein [Clostridium sp. 19966]|uniref:VanW family protein n=1 Tax=Clostridium sp. 19966 TaxID=2768166 RepID=UPI0028E3B73C|nr:VanW family protein [Clostridium sp. 19966]